MIHAAIFMGPEEDTERKLYEGGPALQSGIICALAEINKRLRSGDINKGQYCELDWAREQIVESLREAGALQLLDI